MVKPDNTVPQTPNTDGITVLRCHVCGSEVSGPNSISVAAAMERHIKKTGHRKSWLKK